ncbi:hypothetical protein BESB_069350 [Besnoitia besnoiti]|uniref:Uncharacterized protein n=1 Tax=Besnoitia besnoiti TaxID=94643 RepID=A0A2A9MHM9_BESBE|nr:hypothetical protein BESB_069350 [Besnoitia besnoiti]PFH34902.1 hypothetical protein BESB_069350 [Besnoitia besnoiti]
MVAPDGATSVGDAASVDLQMFPASSRAAGGWPRHSRLRQLRKKQGQRQWGDCRLEKPAASDAVAGRARDGHRLAKGRASQKRFSPVRQSLVALSPSPLQIPEAYLGDAVCRTWGLSDPAEAPRLAMPPLFYAGQWEDDGSPDLPTWESRRYSQEDAGPESSQSAAGLPQAEETGEREAHPKLNGLLNCVLVSDVVAAAAALLERQASSLVMAVCLQLKVLFEVVLKVRGMRRRFSSQRAGVRRIPLPLSGLKRRSARRMPAFDSGTERVFVRIEEFKPHLLEHASWGERSQGLGSANAASTLLGTTAPAARLEDPAVHPWWCALSNAERQNSLQTPQARRPQLSRHLPVM